MIETQTNAGAAFARLAARAALIAAARQRWQRLARTAPARRWRRAALLWPLFTKG